MNIYRSLAKEDPWAASAPYIKLKQGGGVIFKVSILCTCKTRKVALIVHDIVTRLMGIPYLQCLC